MKTLSVRQPFAELILQGRKTIELRTWKTNYRGRIAIHAAQAVKEEALEVYDFQPDDLVRGAVVGFVEIVDVIEFDAESYALLREEHLALNEWPGDVVGWRLKNPERLDQPIPITGRQGLYEISDELVLVPETEGATAVSTARSHEQQPKKNGVVPMALPDPAHPFALQVEPEDERSYGLALYQWPVTANGVEPQPHRVAQLVGSPLLAIADHVLESIRRAGYKLTDLSPRRRDPFWLPEEDGVRLGLLFLAIAPLSKMDRVETISREIRTMPTEEAYYWYSKCTTPRWASRAQKAFRILLSEE